MGTQERKKKKKSNVYKAAAVIHPHRCLLLKFPLSVPTAPTMAPVKDHLLHGPGTASTAPIISAAYSQKPGLASGKKERIILMKYSFANLMSFWFIQVPLRCLSVPLLAPVPRYPRFIRS